MRRRCGAGLPGRGDTCQAGVTELYSLFCLGARILEPFRDFGLPPASGGGMVSDRYANYFHIAGRQACPTPLIRDFQATAECYPGAIWSTQSSAQLGTILISAKRYRS